MMMEKQRENIEKRLNSFSYWLYEKKGLGLQKIIDDILSPLESNISDEEKSKHLIGANILKSNGKISDSEYDNFIKQLPNRKYVCVDKDGNITSNGKWGYVNKLNTNYYDLSVLLTELLIRSFNNDSIVSKNIINSLLSKSSDLDTKEVLMKHKHKLPQLFNTYLTSPNELLNFTKNIQGTSTYGENIENKIVNRLKNIGYDILYQGGNGDFIDMIFSVDFILSSKNGVVVVQVKSNERQVEKFILDHKKGKHKVVDLIVYPTDTKYKIHIIKDNKVIFIDK
jgi:hypothetical protein